jgi:hypothetical protein
MSRRIQEAILNEFPAGDAGAGSSASKLVEDAVSAIAAESQTRADPVTSARTLYSDSVVGASGGVLSTVVKSAFGLAPLVSGLIKLFGGGSAPEPPPLIRYTAPPSLRFDAAVFDGQTSSADHDQTGALRPFVQSQTRPASVAGAPPIEAVPDAAGRQTGAVVNVTVQAMDSQSFLDHSQEIARAVREAMLNLNSLNDVVNDL